MSNPEPPPVITGQPQQDPGEWNRKHRTGLTITAAVVGSLILVAFLVAIQAGDRQTQRDSPPPRPATSDQYTAEQQERIDFLNGITDVRATGSATGNPCNDLFVWHGDVADRESPPVSVAVMDRIEQIGADLGCSWAP